jgi:hypothetical protein
MKLGITYMVFDGEELLEFAVKSIRSEVDHISATYQTISYFGNKNNTNIKQTMENLKSQGLIDELIYYTPKLSLPPKENELKLRNIGLEASKKAGCTHHISSDVDELYTAEQLAYAKKAMEEADYDFSIAPYLVYYKDPTFLITPRQKLVTTLIHPVRNSYEYTKNFPFKIETTRRHTNFQKYREFTMEEILVHHMSYVRKDIRKKLDNSDNGRFYKIDKFVAAWENYKLGDRVCIVPDFLNRKTTKVENIFGINF